MNVTDFWSRRLRRLETTWLRDAWGVAPLNATQRRTLARQRAAARRSHGAACRASLS